MNRWHLKTASPISHETPPPDPHNKPTSLGDEQDSVPTDDQAKSPAD